MLSKLMGDNRIKIPTVVKYLVLWLVIVSTCLVITRAWVSKNLAVSENGLGFALSAELANAFSDADQFAIYDGSGDGTDLVGEPSGNYLPGATDTFYVGLYNSSSVSITMKTFGIETPNIWTTSSAVAYDTLISQGLSDSVFDEVPMRVEVEENGETTYDYKYLGQQVTIEVTGIKIYPATIDEGTDKVKLTGSAVEEVGGTFVSSQYLLDDDFSSVDRIELVSFMDSDGNSSVILDSGHAMVFELQLSFPNITDMDQSVYKGFGKDDGGRCHRLIYATFEQNFETATTEAAN